MNETTVEVVRSDSDGMVPAYCDVCGQAESIVTTVANGEMLIELLCLNPECPDGQVRGGEATA